MASSKFLCVGEEGRHALDLDEDAVAVDLHRIFGEAAVGRVDPGAGLGVEGPLMGATHDHPPVELSFREGDVLVRADALKGADLAAFGPDQKNGPAFDFDLRHVAFPEVVEGAGLLVGHGRHASAKMNSSASIGLMSVSARRLLRGKNSVAPWRRTRITLFGCGATRRPTEWCAAAAATSSIVFSVSTGTSSSTKSRSKLEMMGNRAMSGVLLKRSGLKGRGGAQAAASITRRPAAAPSAVTCGRLRPRHRRGRRRPSRPAPGSCRRARP